MENMELLERVICEEMNDRINRLVTMDVRNNPESYIHILGELNAYADVVATMQLCRNKGDK